MNNVHKTRFYIPIANLNVESDFEVGKVLAHPASAAVTVAKNFPQQDAISDISDNLGRSAFAEVEVENQGGRLIPKDREYIHGVIRESMSILYLMQKQIAGRSSVDSQIFGITTETPSSLNCIVATANGRWAYGFYREGNFAEWTFTNPSIQKIQNRSDFQFLSRVARSEKRTDMEKRIMKAIGLIYEGALELKPQYRFTKIMTAFEVLLLSKKDRKKFALSKYCTMISHALLHPNLKCLCPIGISNNSDEYMGGLKALNLPGICSAYNDFVDWYKLRSELSHEAKTDNLNEKVVKSFEWWSYQYFMKVVEIVDRNNVKNLSQLRQYISKEYELWREEL